MGHFITIPGVGSRTLDEIQRAFADAVRLDKLEGILVDQGEIQLKYAADFRESLDRLFAETEKELESDRVEQRREANHQGRIDEEERLRVIDEREERQRLDDEEEEMMAIQEEEDAGK